MKRKYKLLIVCAVSVTLLLCSVISVGASTDSEEVFYNNRSEVYSSTFGAYVDDENYSWNGKIIEAGKSPQGMVSFNVKAQIDADNPAEVFNYAKSLVINIDPVDRFLDDIEFYDDPTISFTLAQRPAFASEYSSLDYCIVILRDSTTGLSAMAQSTSPDYVSGSMQTTKVIFTGEDLQGFTGVDYVSLYWVWENDFSFTNYTAGVSFYPYATVTYSQLNDRYLTDGWRPNPEYPSGSSSVDDMTDIEQEIMDGSQEGIDSGNQVLSNFGGFLENWREGFIFVIGLFNILFANTWINSLMQIGLALGLIAFILNIAPSIARKISSGKKGGEK